MCSSMWQFWELSYLWGLHFIRMLLNSNRTSFAGHRGYPLTLSGDYSWTEYALCFRLASWYPYFFSLPDTGVVVELMAKERGVKLSLVAPITVWRSPCASFSLSFTSPLLFCSVFSSHGFFSVPHGPQHSLFFPSYLWLSGLSSHCTNNSWVWGHVSKYHISKL